MSYSFFGKGIAPLIRRHWLTHEIGEVLDEDGLKLRRQQINRKFIDPLVTSKAPLAIELGLILSKEESRWNEKKKAFKLLEDW